jgi:hypothetical protein
MISKKNCVTPPHLIIGSSHTHSGHPGALSWWFKRRGEGRRGWRGKEGRQGFLGMATSTFQATCSKERRRRKGGEGENDF